MSKALLIGNGLNRATNYGNISWDNLLRDLCEDFGINASFDLEIPFPLLFEQMINLKSGHNTSSKNRNLKRAIREKFEKFGPNTLHQRLSKLNQYTDILTTNYDYCIETALNPLFREKKSECRLGAFENQLSLRRGYSVNSTKIWHIHGELSSTKKISESSEHYPEESIMIGFNHYAQYLQKIMDNVKTMSPLQNVNASIYKNKLIERYRMDGYSVDESPYWIDRFFFSDIDIVGYTFDFSETHLWWLLSYRAEVKNQMPALSQNTIRYFYKNGQLPARQKGINRMLNALQVDLCPIEADLYMDYYNAVFDKLEQECSIVG